MPINLVSPFVSRSKDISRRSTKREYRCSRLQIGDTRSIESTYDMQTVLAVVTTRRTPLLLVSFYQVRLVVYPAKPSRIDASATVAVMGRPRKILYMREGGSGGVRGNRVRSAVANLNINGKRRLR